jgi:hypothetical protein
VFRYFKDLANKEGYVGDLDYFIQDEIQKIFPERMTFTSDSNEKTAITYINNAHNPLNFNAVNKAY